MSRAGAGHVAHGVYFARSHSFSYTMSFLSTIKVVGFFANQKRHWASGCFGTSQDYYTSGVVCKRCTHSATWSVGQYHPNTGSSHSGHAHLGATRHWTDLHSWRSYAVTNNSSVCSSDTFCCYTFPFETSVVANGFGNSHGSVVTFRSLRQSCGRKRST